MYTSLITAEQIAANADRINYLPSARVIVRGVTNQVFVRDVDSREQAIEKLAALGYVVTREWIGSETFIARAA